MNDDNYLRWILHILQTTCEKYEDTDLLFNIFIIYPRGTQAKRNCVGSRTSARTVYIILSIHIIRENTHQVYNII